MANISNSVKTQFFRHFEAVFNASSDERDVKIAELEGFLNENLKNCLLGPEKNEQTLLTEAKDKAYYDHKDTWEDLSPVRKQIHDLFNRFFLSHMSPREYVKRALANLTPDSLMHLQDAIYGQPQTFVPLVRECLEELGQKSALECLRWKCNKKGIYQGLSLLTVFAQGLSTASHACYLPLWRQYGSKFKDAEYFDKPESALNRPAIMSLLASAAARGCTEPFLIAWSKISRKAQYEKALTALQGEGPIQDPSILHLLIRAASIGFVAPYRSVLNEIQNIPIAAEPTAGPNAGASLFQLLPKMSNDDVQSLLMKVDADELIRGVTKVHDTGPMKDKSYLWCYASLASKHSSVAFVLQAILSHSKSIAFKRKLLDGLKHTVDGVSGLSSMIKSIGTPRDSFFMQFWQIYSSDINLRDLQSCVLPETGLTVSILPLIMKAAALGKLKYYADVYYKFASQFDPADWHARINAQSPTAFQFCIYGICKYNSIEVQSFLKWFDARPDLIAGVELHEEFSDPDLSVQKSSIASLLNSGTVEQRSLYKKLELLCDFNKGLARLQVDSTSEEIETVLQLALKLSKFNLYGAFYSHIQKIQALGLSEAIMIKTLTLCPKGASNYEFSRSFLSQKYIDHAKANTDTRSRHWIKEAILYSCQIANDQLRCDRLQLLANLYVFGHEDKSVFIPNIIPLEVLQVVNAETTTDWCIEEFEKLASERRLVAENKRLRKDVEAGETRNEALKAEIAQLKAQYIETLENKLAQATSQSKVELPRPNTPVLFSIPSGSGVKPDSEAMPSPSFRAAP